MVLYYMVIIVLLYIGLPFWKFYCYLCKVGKERAGEITEDEKT